VTLRPNGLEIFTVVLLHHNGRYLLLQRAASKRFAPGRWTGIGGHVEPHEWNTLREAALRELGEESGIQEQDLEHLVLRRVLLHARPNDPLTLLLYFTAELRQAILPACNEGALHWKSVADLPALDVIESTHAVLPLLIADLQRDPSGQEPVQLGVAHYTSPVELNRVLWV